MLGKSINQIGRKWTVAPFSEFYDKIWVGFCFNTGKQFFLEVFLKPTEKTETLLEIFKTALRLRDQHVLMWQSLEILIVFYTLTSKKIFWKTKTFSKKLECCFLVESTKIENAAFQYKIALSDANVKTNKTGSSKWAYRKERSFASNYFIFLKILIHFKNLL